MPRTWTSELFHMDSLASYVEAIFNRLDDTPLIRRLL